MYFPYKAILCKKMGDLDSAFKHSDLYGYNNDDDFADLILIKMGDIVFIHEHFNSTDEIPNLRSDLMPTFQNFLNNNAPIAGFAIEGVKTLWYCPLSLFEVGRHKCVCPIHELVNWGCRCGGD